MGFDLAGLALIVLKSIAIYLFIILAIRLFGKKELAQLSVIDLVFILLISNSVQNAMVGPDNTLLGGLAAATGLFVINYVLKLILNRFPQVDKLLEGEPMVLIYEGKVQQQNMEECMLTMDELKAAVREHGANDISEVNLAMLEKDGNISVITGFEHKTMRRRKLSKGMLKK
ncbi:MAG TPA: DUF421 domain-containing protein [Chitinophagales bacterium]|nr:DUF421 domain-containing protein [Chitinophagales bacterium]